MFLISILICSCLSVLSYCQKNDLSDSEQEVRQAVAKFSTSFVEANAEALDSLLTGDYIHTNYSGSVLNKRQWLEYIKTRKIEIDSGKLKIESYENKDLKINVYGYSAVVSGYNISKGTREGKHFTTELRFTHLWVKQNGTWKRAAFHDSKIK